MPAPTLMVRSRGSYSRTLFSPAVEMVTSYGAMGPPIRPLVEFPSSVICCFREFASARHCASSSGLPGTMVMN